MTEKKKMYQSPRMKVVKMKAQHMLCGSVNTLANESYLEGSTSGWF